MRTGSRRYRGRSGDEGHGRARINHLDCFSAAIPPRVTCGPATCPRVEEHLGKPCRQAQVRDEEFIIDTGKLCPAGRTYRKDLTAASSPGSGKLCPGFTASQGLAGPRRQADRPSCGPAKKKSSSAPPRVGGCQGGHDKHYLCWDQRDLVILSRKNLSVSSFLVFVSV